MNPNQPDDPGALPAQASGGLPAKPWWLSLTANSQIARVLVLVMGLFGIVTNEGAVQSLLVALTAVAYALTEALTMFGRWRATTAIEFRWPWAKPKA